MTCVSRFKSAVLVIALATSSAADASAWYWTAISVGDSEFFFDAESVQKSADTVTLWIKMVKKDLSGASAMRWKYDCSKRALQSSSLTKFDGQNKYVTMSKAIVEQDVLPDSTGEVFMKIACSPKFPELNADSPYRPAPKNDVFGTTKTVVEVDKSQSVSAPK